MTHRNPRLWSRRAACLAAGVALAGFALAAVAGPGEDRSISALEEQAAFAVKRGLLYLKEKQQPDGSWIEKAGRKVHTDYQGTPQKHVGATALACMAFLANGSVPGRGEFGAELERGLEWLLGCVDENGFITARDQRMYEHAFATLFFAEVYGMTGVEIVREKLKKAVGLIVQAQNVQGGWRYRPGSQDADMSVTVCQVMALRAARNAGIHVPKATIDNAIRYVKQSFMEPRGAYYYQHATDPNGETQRSRYSFALTAAGVTTLYGAGEYSGPYIDRALVYLRSNMPRASDAETTFEYYYGMYYATQAAFQKGGAYWDEWQRETWHDLLEVQNRDGYWQDKVGPVYATAMACVILQIPYQYLPIFER